MNLQQLQRSFSDLREMRTRPVLYIKSFFEATVKSGVKKGDSFINLFQNNDPDSLIDLNE